MKKLFILFCFCLVTILSFGQHGNFTDLRLINGDSVLAGTLNGTVYYDRVLNKFRFRQNSLWIPFSAGITNTAANNEFPKTSTPDLIPSGLFSSSLGNLDLGSTSISGDRTISAKSSSTNNSLYFQTTNGSSIATNALQIFISGINTDIVAPPGKLKLISDTYLGRSLIGGPFGFDFTNYPAGLSEVVATNNSSPNTVLLPFRIAATASSGTPANGFGVGMEFAAQNASNTNIVGSTISSVADDIVAGTEDFSLRFKTITAGTLAEKIRFTSLGEIGIGGANYGTAGQTIVSGGPGAAVTWGAGGGAGTVSTVSVVSANGLAGTVANPTTTPAITLSTTVNGLVKGNGTAFSAASAGTDYQAPITLTTTGTSGAATFISNTLNVPQYAGGSGLPSQTSKVNYFLGTDGTNARWDNSNRVYNGENYGAKHDYQTVSTASITSGTAILTLSSGAFVAGDAGKTIRVFGAGAAGVDLITTILTYTSATQVTLNANASTTISTKQIEWGTDDTPYIQAAINAAANNNGGRVWLPNGIYFIAGPLITSGSNPNSQIYMPLTQTSTTRIEIVIEGESVVFWPPAPFASQSLPVTGVILHSIITGTNTEPSVIGSEFFTSNGPHNLTVPVLKNIAISVKSKEGVTHIAPTMTAFKLYYNETKQLTNCIAITESDPTQSVIPVNVTYGFYLSQEGHTDTHSQYNNITAQGFYYGFRTDEHDSYTSLNAYSCLYAVAMGGVSGFVTHPVFPGGRIENNWCKYGIAFLGGKIVNLTYYAERWPGTFPNSYWFNAVSDIIFPSTQAVNGYINANVFDAGGTYVAIIITGTNTGNLVVHDNKTNIDYTNDNTFRTSVQGNTTSWTGTYFRNIAPTGFSKLQIENDRGSLSSYSQFAHFGSTSTAADGIFGIASAHDYSFLYSGGGSSAGMAIGTRTNTPLIFGTTDANRLQINGDGTMFHPTSPAVFGASSTINGTSPIQILNGGGNNTGIVIKSTGAGTTAISEARFYNNITDLGQVFLSGNGYTPGSGINASGFGLFTTGAGGINIISENAAAKITFSTGTAGAAVNRAIIDISGNLTVGTANNIVGTATNNSATAGNIGEEINAIQSTYTNYTTTATYQNIASITLTAGDWDISAMVTYNSNSATITAAANAIYTISTTTASAAGAVEGQSIGYIPQAALLGTSKFTDVLAPYRVSLSGTTTYYLNTQAAFSVGNPQFVGSIRARRIR